MPRKKTLPTGSLSTPLTPEQAFGRVVAKRRVSLGMTQIDMEMYDTADTADGLQLDTPLERSYISRLERGEKQPCLRTILQLGIVLKVSTADLMLEVEEMLKAQAAMIKAKAKPSR